MIEIVAPNRYEGPESNTLFMAGGITGCPEWQKELIEMLPKTDLVIFNPRRENFPIHDPRAAEAQIMWEREHLEKADIISFWFCSETLNPIVLYELGVWSNSRKPILVGVHPEYKRLKDVVIQTGLIRPDVLVVFSLEDLAGQINVWDIVN